MLLLSLLAVASGSEPERVATPWMDEGSLLFEGLSDRPLVGGGIVRRVAGAVWVGGRVFIPVWGLEPYEGDLFVRGYLTPNETGSLFVEGEVAAWLGRDLFVPAVGGSFGVRVRVHPRLSVGGSFGPTVFHRGGLPDAEGTFLDIGPARIAPRMRATVDFLL